MVNLVSPGVSVSVIDESFYVGAGQGTVPMIFLATRESKPTPDGSGVAQGTLKQNANQLYLISSQRELIQTFGLPEFRSVAGTPENGNALNEYGLLAAHSYLGLANRAYVMRADINLNELEPRVVPPESDPVDLTYWAQLSALSVGLFSSTNGSAWSPVDVTVYEGEIQAGNALPNSGFSEGQIVLAADSNGNFSLFERDGGEWVAFGVDHVSPHTEVPARPANTTEYWFKTTSPNQGANVVVRVFDGDIGRFVDAGRVRFAEDGAEFYTAYFGGNGTGVPAGTLAAFYGDTPGAQLEYTIKWHNGNTVTQALGGTGGAVTADGDLLINGQAVALTTADDLSDVINAINAASVTDVVASDSNGALLLENTQGLDIEVALDSGLATDFIDVGVYSNFADIGDAAPAYFASFDEPSSGPEDGVLWYDPAFKVDLLVRNGASWVDIDPAGVLVQPGEPTERSDGQSLEDGDVWVQTLNITDYPTIYRYRIFGVSSSGEWVLVDNSDQTSPDGVLFTDARPDPDYVFASAPQGLNNGGGSNPDLDPDRPDPLLYPTGTLLWNTRYSGRNVKRWDAEYEFDGQFVGGRWVSVSGTATDGSLLTGQAAVRRAVELAMAGAIVNNDEIRAESIFYNLIAAPGFPELADELVSLNIDRRETAFIIADSPMDLTPDSTSLQNWAQSITVNNENIAYYYPSGRTTNLNGQEVVVPASHMALRTFAFNDLVAYPWFAPAGFQRGRVNNATQVGYVDREGEFVPVTLNQGQRDVLYTNNVNPIVFAPGRGLTVFGQKTRYPLDSALDRVNVARLINYIRFQAERIAEPFLFQPNDTQTRIAVKDRYDSFLDELVTLRGVFDFLVVCDESNNTPNRIDRNELWVDIAISPTKAVEFIYIPIRVRNTGADLTI